MNTATAPVTVKSIAFLDTFCREHGLPSTQRVRIPEEGLSARELAEAVGLPLGRIEGVFHNHTIAGLTTRVMPGDRIAFVPPGTPASHPAFFGAFDKRAGRRTA